MSAAIFIGAKTAAAKVQTGLLRSSQCPAQQLAAVATFPSKCLRRSRTLPVANHSGGGAQAQALSRRRVSTASCAFLPPWSWWGTLASLWASVVLIGGYRNSLEHIDFWIATVLIFIEAFRVFIRNFKFDNQSLFGSTKALRGMSSSFARMLWRPRQGNELLLIISWVINIFDPFRWLGDNDIDSICHMAGLAVMARTMHLAEAPRLMRQLREKRPLLLWVALIIPPTVAVVAVPFAVAAASGGLIAALFAALLALRNIITQLVAVVLLNWRPPCITALTSRCRWGQRILYVLKLISAIVVASGFRGTMEFATVVLLFGSLQDPAVANGRFGRWIDVIMNICFLWALIPAAVAQIALSCWRLVVVSLHGYGGPAANMKASMAVFYVLALCQGSLYIVACILAPFSFFPRRSLVRRTDIRGKWGAKAVDLYYERAYATRMEAGVFAEDTNSLASFALDSLLNSTATSSSREKQLAGVRVLHGLLLLQPRGSNQEIISVITRYYEKAVPTLISMLGWTSEQDRDIRLFAARVVTELSGDLRIAGIPGAVKLVSSLLDLDAEKQSAAACNNQPAAHEQSEPERPGGGNNGARCWSWVCPCWPLMKNKWSIPEERPLTWSLPILGLEILEKVACDADNCAEFIKVTNLVHRIIDLTSYTSSNNESITDNNNNNALKSSSLNLLRRLATTNGKIGVTLRQELWESPFLVCNLAAILENSRSCSPQVLKPAMDIIAILAWDEVARHELGTVQVIIYKLVHVFIVGQDGPTNHDPSLRVAAGEALTNLAMESPANCLAMLEERRPGYKLVKDLTDMLDNDEYRCVAASLLQNLCACSRIRDMLQGPGATNHLSSALPVVLENIMAAEGKQLEVLVSLASEICYVFPSQCFIQGLGEACVRKLVDTLNSSKRPSHEYPRMRRAIVEMVISILGRYPYYAVVFRRQGMMDALSKTETSPSRVEKYRVFLGNEGVVLEHGLPLRDLVAKARRLIDSTTLSLGAQPANDHT